MSGSSLMISTHILCGGGRRMGGLASAVCVGVASDIVRAGSVCRGGECRAGSGRV